MTGREATSLPPNGFGLYDMGWQWCADWYRPDDDAVVAAANLGVRLVRSAP